MIKRILIIAGEASGDMHAAKLITQVREKKQDITFFGIGGSKMRAAGTKILIDSKQLSVLGIVEVLPRLWTIYLAFQDIKSELKRNPPNLVVLIDFSGFNLKVAKVAKALGIKVLYYISPQIWASRQGRVEKIKKYVDQMAVIFPFEVDFYRNLRVPVKLVRHPLLDDAYSEYTQETARNLLGLDLQKKAIGILPGSRNGEIKNLLPTLLATAKKLKQDNPDLQFVLPLASTVKHADIAHYLAEVNVPIKVVDQNIYDVLRACDAAVVASGTATLQVALMNIPMAIVYRLSPITYAIGKRIVKLSCIGLCNIVAGKKIVNEYIQDEVNVKNLAAEINKILHDENYATKMKQELMLVRNNLEDKKNENQIADIVLETLK